MNKEFRPSGVITLITDFGLRDPFVGLVKGVILSENPCARVVDVTHGILPYQSSEAGFWMSRTFKYFPEGTIHLAVVDPGVGTNRDIYIAEAAQHLFIGPDNGLFGELAERNQCSFRRVEEMIIDSVALKNRSSTFDGRDVFAPLVSNILSGKLSTAECGPTTNEYCPSKFRSAQREGRGIVGSIVTIDHFGNLISNIGEELVSNMDFPKASIAGKEIPFRTNYSAVKAGELVCLINSFGVIEIARSNGDAAEFLGVGREESVRILES